jgi:hypothetical protein
VDDQRRELERIAAASSDPADHKAVRMARCRAGEHCGCLEETDDVILIRRVRGTFPSGTSLWNKPARASAIVIRHVRGDRE